MKTAIFILGMHRSGTSALGGTLDLMGLEFGSDLMKGNEGNPKGYFENNFVYKLNEKILKESASKWDDYRLDVSMIDKTKRELYKREAKEIIEAEFRYATNFAIKDPRICLLFPFWEEVCRELEIAIKVIIPYRNPIEVATSLKKRNEFSYEKSLILWSKHFLSAEYLTRKYERIFTSFDELITDTENVVKLLEDFTEMEAPKSTLEKIKNEFLDSSVKHNNISLSNFTKDTPLFLQKILQVIKEKNFEEKMLDEIRKDFLFSLKFFQHKEIFDTIENLRLENSLLEKVKDVTKVDSDYYLTKYQDVKNAKVDPLKHFANHGKKEGRHPNYYCEYHKISVVETPSVSIKAYLCEQEIESRKKELEQKQQELQKQTEELKTRESTISTLETQKSEAQKNAQIKQEELTKELNSVKELHSNTTKKIQELNAQLQKTQEQAKDLGVQNTQKTTQLEQKSKELEQKQQELQKQTEELKTRESTISTLETQKSEVWKSLQMRVLELQKQNEQKKELEEKLDEIVNDLASIKESKCWLYTKPIRDLQKVFKG